MHRVKFGLPEKERKSYENQCLVPYLKDLIHICLELEAQGWGMTFNRVCVGSKYPYIISYRGKWLYLFCLGCMYLTTSKYDLKLLMLLLINFRLSSKETFRYFTKSSGMKKSIDSVTVLFLKSNAKNPRNGYFLRKSVISASVMKTI